MKRTSTVASRTLAAALALTACGGTGTESEEALHSGRVRNSDQPGEATASPSASSAHADMKEWAASTSTTRMAARLRRAS